MSNLELLIRQCRYNWEKMGIEPRLMDVMVDTFIGMPIHFEAVTDEHIQTATHNYLTQKEKLLHEASNKSDDRE